MGIFLLVLRSWKAAWLSEVCKCSLSKPLPTQSLSLAGCWSNSNILSGRRHNSLSYVQRGFGYWIRLRMNVFFNWWIGLAYVFFDNPWSTVDKHRLLAQLRILGNKLLPLSLKHKSSWFICVVYYGEVNLSKFIARSSRFHRLGCKSSVSTRTYWTHPKCSHLQTKSVLLKVILNVSPSKAIFRH